MKLIQNSGADRVIDLIRPHLKPGNQLSCVSPSFSLHAFAELRQVLATLAAIQLVLPSDESTLEFLGTEGDRAARNGLQTRWLANQCALWVSEKVDLRWAPGPVPQGALVQRNPDAVPEQSVLGSFAFSTAGLGLTPGNPMSLIQASESAGEAAQLAQWFDQQWSNLPPAAEATAHSALVSALQGIGAHRDPFTIYSLILHHLFYDRGEELDEERIVKSATGIRNTVVWKKLFRFQRDGVVGAIDVHLGTPTEFVRENL